MPPGASRGVSTRWIYVCQRSTKTERSRELNAPSRRRPLDYAIVSVLRTCLNRNLFAYLPLQNAPVHSADLVPGELIPLLAVRRRRSALAQEHGQVSSTRPAPIARRQGLGRPTGLPAAGHPLRLSTQLNVPVRRTTQRDKHAD